MNHATDGLLQAYHDGEIAGPALTELRDHLAVCAECTQELDALRHMNGLFHQAVALTDITAPMLRTRAAVVHETTRAVRMRRLTASGLAKAAMLLLALTGAVAAIPGSPVRRAVEAALARLFEQQPQQVIEPVAEGPVPDVRDVRIMPVDGRVRILVHGPIALDVTVLLGDADYAEVERSAVGQDIAFRSGTGKLEVTGLQRGALRITIPRAVDHATIEIDGKVYVYKQDGALHLSGPAGRGQGDEVSFRISE